MAFSLLLLGLVIFQISSSIVAQKFVEFGGQGKQISARSCEEILLTNPSSQFYHYVGPGAPSGTGWMPWEAGITWAAASSDGHNWRIRTDKTIQRYDPSTNTWENMPGELKKIRAASKDIAIGISPTNDVMLFTNNQWTKIGSNATAAAIGEDGDRWIISQDGVVLHWETDNCGERWVYKAGLKDAIDIDCYNASRVFAADADKHLHLWKNDGWQQTTEGIGISVSIDAKRLYVVGGGGNTTYAAIA